MKLKFIGYANPPLPIIAFAPSVYSDGKQNFFSTSNKDYLIEEFWLLDERAQITEVPTAEEIWKEQGEPEFYVFYDLEVKNITGEIYQIKNELQSLLDGERLNVFAKISIAIFLKQKGISQELLSRIPDLDGWSNFFYLKEQFQKTISELSD